jgi:putative molybdopterin biosynthesis protein
MTRYREIGEGLARRVLAGDLVPGDELPGIRELGRQWATTPSTASRAQRALAEAGLIELAGRRRALVAADALFAARRFLHGHVILRLAGSDDPALDLVVRGLGRNVVPVQADGSAAGLRAVVQVAPMPQRPTSCTTAAGTTHPSPAPCCVAAVRIWCTCGDASRGY